MSAFLPAGQILLFLVIPTLALLAFRQWIRHWRAKLPRWRNIMGMSAISATFLGYLAYAGMFLLGFLGIDPGLRADAYLSLSLALIILGFFLGFSLRGAPRSMIFITNFLTAALIYSYTYF